ncbi:iron-sulfur cluster assembly accessory protein [Paenibacillus filicis]|uniref:Iron-sulfur cluster assembly accessory protein n=1 Tax=Paenibacillus filicis TaxID=669464 RepID=A0ABU9DNL3_9BACL
MIQISDAAADKIIEMIRDIDSERYFLRVGVSDGGCSGLSYSIRFDDTLGEGDRAITWGEFQVVIDYASVEYLEGIQIDYKDSGLSGGFTIDNPNAKFSCGCGASFRTAAYRGKVEKCD